MLMAAVDVPLLSSVADGIHTSQELVGPTLNNNTILNSEPLQQVILPGQHHVTIPKALAGLLHMHVLSAPKGSCLGLLDSSCTDTMTSAQMEMTPLPWR